MVAFTVTNWGQLVSKRRISRGEEPLTAADCYRFALSHPAVQVAITAPKNAREMRENLKALELGPLSPEEMARARRIGEAV
jgi:aryl-alcohol dehydrogenase-like predicted oxidoreductase